MESMAAVVVLEVDTTEPIWIACSLSNWDLTGLIMVPYLSLSRFLLPELRLDHSPAFVKYSELRLLVANVFSFILESVLT